MNGFSPVRIKRCGSATGMLSLPSAEPAAAAGVPIGCQNKPNRRLTMGDLFRRGGVNFVAVLLTVAVAQTSFAQTPSDPPTRVGRLAFTQGTVSFHPHDQDGWTTARVNTPLTSGDAVWTEPNAHGEISLGGSRIRLQEATQLDMLAIDDSQTRLQLDQGRVDVRSVAMDPNRPYEILTPRGTGALLQKGDYYLEAGSAQDATRLGVRAGAARFQALNGQALDVHPGEVAEATGDPNNPQLRLINTAPPAQPAYWAARDRQVVYDQPPQYLTAAMTGYEDLNAYGSWINDPGYGQVWSPRGMPAGWAPYRTGHWINQPPWGWTWVDDQPWGFAPYHYGRWANSGGRWFWVPPERDVQPVYAPALVAFVGGVELAATLGNRSVAPVGWFPLGPREVYVPSYTTNQDYYLRLNRSAQVQDEILRQRWERAQRREAFEAGQRSVLMNQRFATVVPATAFVNSQPVTAAALRVPQERLTAAPVAPVSAPPAPTASIAPAAAATATKAPPPAAAVAAPNLAVAKTAVADMPTLAKPTTPAQPATAPGPQIATTQPKVDNTAKPALPPLAPRQGAAPPALAPQQQAAPVEPPKPQATPAPAPQQQAKPGEPAKPQATPSAPPLPTQQARPVEPPKPQASPAPAPQQQAKPGEPAKPQATPAPTPQQQAKPGEPPKPQATPAPAPQQAKPVEAPKPQPAPPPQAHPAPPPPQPQGQQGHAAPPTPQQQPQHAAPPPPQQQARPAPPPPQQQPQHAAPSPPPQQQQPQHAAPPPPQQQQARPAPPPPPPQQQPPHPAPQQAQNPQPQQPNPQQPQQQQQQQKKPDEKK